MAQGYKVDINVNSNSPTLGYGGGAGPMPGNNSAGWGNMPPPSFTPGANSSQSNYMATVLRKLEMAVDKLNVTLTNLSLKPGPGGGGGGGAPGDSAQEQKKQREAINNMLQAGVLGTIVTTAFRWINANSNSLMSQATARGNFAGSGILGSANQNFAGYVGNLWDITRQQQLSHGNAIAQGIGTVAGGAIGAFGGPSGIVAGGAAGSSVGTYVAAFLRNANVEQAGLETKAYYERAALASNSEYREGFSRFGMGSTPYTIGNNGVSPVIAHLSSAFEKKYSTLNGNMNPYYNDIQNITPYLQSSPLSPKTGDLNEFIQNLQKAGVATADYARVTAMGVQYQALTGQQQIGIATVLKAARSKYGDAFGVGEMQTSLNLMSMGYTSSQAQNLAYQSAYNPGVLTSAQQYATQSVPDYYKNKALSSALGFDVNRSLMTGHMTGASASTIKRYKAELAAYNNGGEPGPLLTIANSGLGLNSSRISSLIQPRAKTLSNPLNASAGFTDAQTEAIKDVTQGIKDALNNVGDIFMTATNVTINTQQPMSSLQRGISDAGQSSWVRERDGLESLFSHLPSSSQLKSAYSHWGGHRATKKS